MELKELERIFEDLDFVHSSGTPEELRAAEYLKGRCEALGVPARLEGFPVPMGEIEEAEVLAAGVHVPCRGVACCGSGTVEGELYYMPGLDPVSIAGAKDRIVLLDSQGVDHFTYQDLMKAGARGILFQFGNLYYPDRDIEDRDLRALVVGEERKVLCAMIHAESAVALVRQGVKNVRITVRQREYEGRSHNVAAEIPGRREEWITLTAHYDTTAHSHGAYDNLSGCVGLLLIMEALRDAELNYGLRFVFCGSEERGLLGSRAYVEAHGEEMEKTALNVNLDMIGTVMGKFIACATAEDKLAHYLGYMGAELGFPVEARTGVYSSDSTSFADKGVPAVSLARIAGTAVAPIHCRYDRKEALSMEQLRKDAAFITEFTRRMASAALCPVSRTMPESIKKQLDEYLYRKRKNS
ncbi:MAG: M28 family peptidase [Oscillospiraceae bacterium]|nr:M28 family peptidase [Oscillospiraceae bacterium]